MKRLKFNQMAVIMLITSFSMFCPKVFSQVTIGSGEEPVPGAILQLNNIEGVIGGGANATKGMMLPRVKLIKSADANLAATIQGATGTYDPLEHIGLWVYNTNSDACPMVKPGPFVWDGDKWQPLIKPVKYPLEAETATTLTDRQGHVYTIANFGVAGTWMTQNLRTTSQPGEANPMTENGTFALTPIRHYAYPKVNGPYVVSGPPSYWLPEYGLLYNWYAATNNDNCYTANQGQSTGPATGPGEIESLIGAIQGICPTGWHLPSDREWNQLEKELTEHASLYSDVPDGVWNPVWETTEGVRGLINGRVMKSKTRVKGVGGIDVPTATDGGSNAPTANGFNALITGAIGGSGSDLYGTQGYFWTSSVQVAILAYYREVQAGNMNGVHRSGLTKGWYFSVRCKKN